MTTTLDSLISLLGSDLGDNWSSVTTAAGDAGKTYLTDDNLYEKTPDWVTDYAIVYLPLGPSGAGSPETRIVAVLSGNKLMPLSIFSAQVLIAVPYEVHRLFTRTEKQNALRKAATLLFPEYFEVVRDFTKSFIANQYEYSISALGIYQNRPHQVLIPTSAVVPVWQVATTYALGQMIRPVYPTHYNGYTYICTQAGTSHATTEPTWPTTSTPVTDNTCQWTLTAVPDVVTTPWDIITNWNTSPDGLLSFDSSFTVGTQFQVIGIKPLSFSGSGASEAVALSSPMIDVLSARAGLYLAQARFISAAGKDTTRLEKMLQNLQVEYDKRKAIHWMKAPDGTFLDY
jgi:hypothetical protein